MDLFARLDKSKSCCSGMKDDLYSEIHERIKSDVDKWKAYLKVDKIELYNNLEKVVL